MQPCPERASALARSFCPLVCGFSLIACRRVRGDRGPPSPFDEEVLHLQTHLRDDVLWLATSKAVQQQPAILGFEAKAGVVAVVVSGTEALRLLAVAVGHIKSVQHVLEIC